MNIEQLQAENARLKAEVERLNAVIESHKDAGIRIFAIMDEERRLTKHLKAEVERLEGLVKYWQIEAETDHAHWVRHAETNERLRKAGDYMADHLAHEFGTCPSIEAWNAAKEGKPSV